MTKLIVLFTAFFLCITAHGKNPRVEIVVKDMGTMVIELYPEVAPKTVKNFLSYVNDGFYNDTLFHRVISNFMIQGGGFILDKKNKKLIPKETKEEITNESDRDNHMKNLRGTIAMARTHKPHSATSQFFINHKNNMFLNSKGKGKFGYTVFGKLKEGEAVLDQIAKVKTMPGDKPVKNIFIKTIKLLN